MPQRITADFHVLMDQAPGTVAVYLDKAIESIDNAFGDGYAKQNPSLIGAFIQAAATDMGCAVLAQQIHAGLESIAENLSTTDMEPVADALDKIANNLGDDQATANALERIADRLNRVAYGLTGGYDGDIEDSVPDALRSTARILSGKDN
jgi:predicted DNA-binding protein